MATASLFIQKVRVVLSGTMSDVIMSDVIMSDARKAPCTKGRINDIN